RRCARRRRAGGRRVGAAWAAGGPRVGVVEALERPVRGAALLLRPAVLIAQVLLRGGLLGPQAGDDLLEAGVDVVRVVGAVLAPRSLSGHAPSCPRTAL